jgi:hypothetical protein
MNFFIKIPQGNIKKALQHACVFILLALVSGGCSVYSFKQGSIPPEVKTISIANIYNESGGGPANLGQIFTEKLKTYYQQNSRLSIVKENGDWQLEGKIVSYQTMPIAPQGDKAALNRLTIRVQVKFVSTVDEKAGFDQAFSFFDDYPQNQTLTMVEGELISKISEQIVFDIFTKTTSNW